MTTWLFRPFDRIAGLTALIAGLAVLILTAGLAWRAGLVTDGVLDLHFGTVERWWVLVLQGLINWLSLALTLLLFGLWLSRSRFRVLDLLGTQSLARWPMLLGVVYLSIPAVGGQIERLTFKLMDNLPSEPDQVMASAEFLLDAMWLTVISLPLLAMLAWMVWLMYHAYALVCNISGQRAVFSFIGAVVIAEIVSKALLLVM